MQEDRRPARCSPQGSSGTTTSVTGSNARPPNSSPPRSRITAERRGHSQHAADQDQAQAVERQEPNHARRLGAERDANPHFARPLRHRVADDAVQADAGQHQREDGKRRQDERRELGRQPRHAPGDAPSSSSPRPTSQDRATGRPPSVASAVCCASTRRPGHDRETARVVLQVGAVDHVARRLADRPDLGVGRHADHDQVVDRPRSGVRISRPTASPSGQKRRAIASLMIATAWLPSRSASVKPRPRRMGMPIASKKPESTSARSAENARRSLGGSWPSTVKPIDCVLSVLSGRLSVTPSASTPGTCRKRSSICRV